MTPMPPDIVIDKFVTSDEIKHAAAKVLNVSPEHVLVSETDPMFLPNLQSFRVACWFFPLNGGDFPYRLQVIPLEKELLPTVEYEMEAAFCEALGCKCLIMGDNISDYVWILIRGRNNYQRVLVNDDLLDENGWLHIKRYLDCIDSIS